MPKNEHWSWFKRSIALYKSGTITRQQFIAEWRFYQSLPFIQDSYGITK